MKNRRAFFNVDRDDVIKNPCTAVGLVIVLAVGLMAGAFIVSMFMMDVRHSGVNLWSVIRFVSACFLVAIAVEDALTKEIHDVLLLGLALSGIGTLLLSAIGHDACVLSCFISGGFDFSSLAGSGLGVSSTSGYGSGSGLFQFNLIAPRWCLIGGSARIVGALCVSLPMLAITLIWSGSFGSGDVLMCIGAGLILGPAHILSGVAIAMVMAGVLSSALLLFGILKRTDSIPFGPFLSIGFLIMLY